MIQTHQGACHCGRVSFEVRADLNYGIDLSSIKVRPFDGQNWEATAAAYYERLKKPPAA